MSGRESTVQNVNMQSQSGNAEIEARIGPRLWWGLCRFLRNASAVLSVALMASCTAESQPELPVTTSRGSRPPFQLPTANRALLDRGKGPDFFVGTAGKTWETGMFGYVRSSGTQMHEGLDIRPLQRDRRGEPLDPVLAAADGTVAYINRKPGLSNYGNYIVVHHSVQGLEIYSLYAHLAQVRAGLAAGQAVKAGEPIAVMGRTANTRQGISRDRAHLHFELNFIANDKFSTWYTKRFPGQRNDHGNWNGRNFVAVDPAGIFLAQEREGAKFDLVSWVRQRTELCRVFARRTDFPWLHRCRPLIRPNPVAEKEGTVGYEIALDFNGLAFELIPRAASEAPRATQLLSVNENEARKKSAQRFLANRRGKWQLTQAGLDWVALLTW
jgi:murein DD-endopeptidase MepM/ murein hydrolase activator NlpD